MNMNMNIGFYELSLMINFVTYSVFVVSTIFYNRHELDECAAFSVLHLFIAFISCFVPGAFLVFVPCSIALTVLTLQRISISGKCPRVVKFSNKKVCYNEKT